MLSILKKLVQIGKSGGTWWDIFDHSRNRRNRRNPEHNICHGAQAASALGDAWTWLRIASASLVQRLGFHQAVIPPVKGVLNLELYMGKYG